ncbi:MAG: PH domain-containing protein [Spirosomaceae bacterium]|jgi:hypothetical protein|nr:PH domain-containing protein [Spirosomataceae bacterium]
MGFLDGIMGNAAAISTDSLQKEFGPIMVEGESLESAFKVVRDLIVFTNKRLILVDKQGLTGSKVSFQSVPYRSIVRFAKESAGMFDLDAEIKIWVSGSHEPINLEFKKDRSINEIYQLLGKYTLK